MLEKRKGFVPLYASIWAGVIVSAILAFSRPHIDFIF
jgi:hypothetical protein